ncbi:MAG: peptidase M10A and M12B matrixin and adamalysin [Chromatiaceae bacterium]|nr:peptidase M10A and M12B matrixin and adamalysin [Gammaproteobacteria bacterium]MCP5300993.1 peptidase M10A and M12B matrixin and adamalysin [Chromatiaceae bacterium]MCP5421534.1 peptidase M10A and M12B matrixin and adamalysin [Chromatiaceae bacterium]
MKTLSSSLALLAAVASAGANAITLQFDYTYDDNGFFADATRRSILEQAGAYFGSRITDDLDAITSGGGNHFTAIFNRPDTDAVVNLADYSVAADTLVVFAGGRDLGGSLGQGGPGGWSAGGSGAFLDTVATRGEIGDVSGPSAVEFAPWGGSITFNTTSVWDFNPDLSAGATISDNDFYSVALHELGHLLGFGTAESWYAMITGGGMFAGGASSTVFGGDVPLHGDAAHWQENLTSTVGGIGSQEVAMDPTLTVGTRKLFTDLDFAALDDIGWDVTAVPLPSAAFPFVAALFAAGAAARRGRRRAGA